MGAEFGSSPSVPPPGPPEAMSTKPFSFFAALGLEQQQQQQQPRRVEYLALEPTTDELGQEVLRVVQRSCVVSSSGEAVHDPLAIRSPRARMAGIAMTRPVTAPRSIQPTDVEAEEAKEAESSGR